MSYQNVKTYFERIGLADRITVHEQTGDTVEHAAGIIGCTPGEIAKSMTFLVDGKPIMVVMAGDTKVNSSKFKQFFHQKPSMVPWEQVETLIGHQPGAVCPFALKGDVPVYLDESLKRFPVVHTSGGMETATIRLSLQELEKYAHAAGWVDVCKGWLANEVVYPA